MSHLGHPDNGKPAEGSVSMEQFNILVCDDDRSIVEAIEIYLKQENYHVIKAYNGLEALEALEENEIHLILMDVMMPLLDGKRRQKPPICKSQRRCHRNVY